MNREEFETLPKTKQLRIIEDWIYILYGNRKRAEVAMYARATNDTYGIYTKLKDTYDNR